MRVIKFMRLPVLGGVLEPVTLILITNSSIFRLYNRVSSIRIEDSPLCEFRNFYRYFSFAEYSKEIGSEETILLSIAVIMRESTENIRMKVAQSIAIVCASRFQSFFLAKFYIELIVILYRFVRIYHVAVFAQE